MSPPAAAPASADAINSAKTAAVAAAISLYPARRCRSVVSITHRSFSSSTHTQLNLHSSPCPFLCFLAFPNFFKITATSFQNKCRYPCPTFYPSSYLKYLFLFIEHLLQISMRCINIFFSSVPVNMILLCHGPRPLSLRVLLSLYFYRHRLAPVFSSRENLHTFSPSSSPTAPLPNSSPISTS